MTPNLIGISYKQNTISSKSTSQIVHVLSTECVPINSHAGTWSPVWGNSEETTSSLRWSGRGGAALKTGISTLTKGAERVPKPFLACEDQGAGCHKATCQYLDFRLPSLLNYGKYISLFIGHQVENILF